MLAPGAWAKLSPVRLMEPGGWKTVGLIPRIKPLMLNFFQLGSTNDHRILCEARRTHLVVRVQRAAPKQGN